MNAKLWADGVAALLLAACTHGALALSGPGVTGLSDLTQSQILLVVLAVIAATTKTVHSHTIDPNA